MIKKSVLPQEIGVKPKEFHEVFPYALSWTTTEGKKKFEHFAYFPYDDYRSKYINTYKRAGGKNFRKFKTPKRVN
jgi:hypothetical protein